MVHLLIAGGGIMEQKVEYVGLPNQHFECRQVGHLTRSCPRKQNTSIPTETPIGSQAEALDQSWVQVNKSNHRRPSQHASNVSISPLPVHNAFAILQHLERQDGSS
jgi:hypothetical protein